MKYHYIYDTERWDYMILNGLQKLTLLDFPGKVACTLFFGGCNFRCPFCHNASLVLAPEQAEQIPEETVLAFLKKRQGVLDGVCITGGEPLLQTGLATFIKKIRDLGYAVKLDTNGYYPKRLQTLVEAGLLDYIAMDIKNCPEKYPQTIGVSTVNLSPVFESVDYIRTCGVPHEFRTTVVRGLHTAQDMEGIADWLEGEEQYFLQGFVDSGDILKPGFTAYTPGEMREFLSLVQEKVPKAKLRGIAT